MIFAILGKSGSGKTKTFISIKEKTGLNGLVQYTTRPPRENEIDGKSYNFIEIDEFLNMIELNKLATNTSFTVVGGNLWYYGYAKKDITNDKGCMLVVNPQELAQLKETYGARVISILIDANLQTRIDRYFDRDEMTKENVKELTRRMIADEKDFEGIKFNYVVDNNGSLKDTIDEIVYIINKERYAKKETIEDRTYLYTGTMRSGKSEFLIKRVKADFDENNRCLALKPEKDTRSNNITSRNGQYVPCVKFNEEENLYDLVVKYINRPYANYKKELNVYIDESQFMTQKQVKQLMKLKSEFDYIKIFCYGLLINFKNVYFESTDFMVKHFDKVIKIPYLCEKCGIENATNHILKINGIPVTFGNDVVIEGENTEYECVCYNCYTKYLRK